VGRRTELPLSRDARPIICAPGGRENDNARLYLARVSLPLLAPVLSSFPADSTLSLVGADPEGGQHLTKIWLWGFSVARTPAEFSLK